MKLDVFQFVSFAFCPGTGHHWDELGSAAFAPSLGPTDIDRYRYIDIYTHYMSIDKVMVIGTDL